MSRVGSVRQRGNTSASVRGEPPSAEGVKALESVLLIGSSPSKREHRGPGASDSNGSGLGGGGGAGGGGDEDDEIDQETQSKFAAGAESLVKNARVTSRAGSRSRKTSGVDIKG
jgi:hypothetical protein